MWIGLVSRFQCFSNHEACQLQVKKEMSQSVAVTFSDSFTLVTHSKWLNRLQMNLLLSDWKAFIATTSIGSVKKHIFRPRCSSSLCKHFLTPVRRPVKHLNKLAWTHHATEDQNTTGMKISFHHFTKVLQTPIIPKKFLMLDIYEDKNTNVLLKISADAMPLIILSLWAADPAIGSGRSSNIFQPWCFNILYQWSGARLLELKIKIKLRWRSSSGCTKTPSRQRSIGSVRKHLSRHHTTDNPQIIEDPAIGSGRYCNIFLQCCFNIV